MANRSAAHARRNRGSRQPSVCRDRQRGAAPADFEDFGGEAASSAIPADTLQLLFGGSADCSSHRLSSQPRELADQLYRGGILDCQRHRCCFLNALILRRRSPQNCLIPIVSFWLKGDVGGEDFG